MTNKMPLCFWKLVDHSQSYQLFYRKNRWLYSSLTTTFVVIFPVVVRIWKFWIMRTIVIFLGYQVHQTQPFYDVRPRSRCQSSGKNSKFPYFSLKLLNAVATVYVARDCNMRVSGSSCNSDCLRHRYTIHVTNLSNVLLRYIIGILL